MKCGFKAVIRCGKMKVTSLVENTAGRGGVTVEHGLSLYIETKNKKIIFDMGQSDAFIKNAKLLDIDLENVDAAILSHGHYDHGGGLRYFIQINQKAPIYVHSKAFLPYYNGKEKYIGLDPSLKEEKRIVFTDERFRINEDMELFSCNGRIRKNSFGAFGLKEKTDAGFTDDLFLHEQYLLIEEDGKRVLISGCSHKGIIDITEWFRPDVLIGGFHFSKMPLDTALEEAALKLDAYGTKYYTCHCTGTEQYDFMKNYIKDLQYLACGQVILV